MKSIHIRYENFIACLSVGDSDAYLVGGNAVDSIDYHFWKYVGNEPFLGILSGTFLGETLVYPHVRESGGEGTREY